jgi:hypothetical protein
MFWAGRHTRNSVRCSKHGAKILIEEARFLSWGLKPGAHYCNLHAHSFVRGKSLIQDFCLSCREQQISNMFDIFCHSWQKFLVCGKQLIATLRCKDVRMRDTLQNDLRTSLPRKVAMSCLPHTRNFCYYYLNLFENGSPSAVKKNWFSRGRLWIHIHCLEIQNTYYLFTTILTKENYVN